MPDGESNCPHGGCPIPGVVAERDRLREALTEALTVLGTGDCKQPSCEGCDYERGEATRILKEALDA